MNGEFAFSLFEVVARKMHITGAPSNGVRNNSTAYETQRRVEPRQHTRHAHVLDAQDKPLHQSDA
jgi:hypothetical protein